MTTMEEAVLKHNITVHTDDGVGPVASLEEKPLGKHAILHRDHQLETCHLGNTTQAAKKAMMAGRLLCCREISW